MSGLHTLTGNCRIKLHVSGFLNSVYVHIIYDKAFPVQAVWRFESFFFFFFCSDAFGMESVLTSHDSHDALAMLPMELITSHFICQKWWQPWNLNLQWGICVWNNFIHIGQMWWEPWIEDSVFLFLFFFCPQYFQWETVSDFHRLVFLLNQLKH